MVQIGDFTYVPIIKRLWTVDSRLLDRVKNVLFFFNRDLIYFIRNHCIDHDSLYVYYVKVSTCIPWD